MKNQEEIASPNPKRLCNVIVLTDNRDSPNAEKTIPSQTAEKSNVDFRSSAFQETSVDPLQFPKNQLTSLRDEQLLAELNRRITDLQSRVQALESKQCDREQNSEEKNKIRKHKIRRKNIDMKKDRVCSHCGKNYGTETALKYHVKLKHSESFAKKQEIE